MPYNTALWYAVGLMLATLTKAIMESQFYITGSRNGMKVRVAVCSLIYRKVNDLFEVFYN